MARPCPISREAFAAAADDVPVTLHIGDTEIEVPAKETDGIKSLGWSYDERGTVNIGGIDVPCMIQVHVTCIGSKIK